MARRIAEVVPMLLVAMWLGDSQALANLIISTSPAQNEKAAPRGLNVAATCDSTIDGATVTQSTFRVQGDRTGRINGTYSASGATFQLDPASDFKPGELVRVTATNAIESTSDVPLTPRVWQYTAAAGRAAGVMKSHGSFGSGNSTSVALGDLDGDGDLDALVGNYNNQAESVWLNDGTGTFTAGVTFGGEQSFDVELGDLDGDGDLDAVVGNEQQAASVWLNNGSAAFSSGGTFGNDARDIALGDLDGDGDLDVVCAGSELIFLNDGSGAFTPHPGTPFFGPGNGQGYGVDLGDLDGDGDLDAVIANVNGNPETVWLNDGSGNLGEHPVDEDFGTGDSTDVALGDLDGDGDLDAVVVNYSGEDDTVWLNDGTGVFSAHATTIAALYGLDGELGDLDGDGDLDLIVADASGAGESVWLNDGSGGFTAHPSTPVFGTGNLISYDLALGDLDGDGDLDAIVANDNNAGKTVWVNSILTISPLSVATTEGGGTGTFSVVLDAQPAANVSIQLDTSDATEGRLSTDGMTQQNSVTLTFTNANWSTPQTVTVHGQDDNSDDGTVAYTIVTAATTSTDLSFDGSNPPDISASNSDDDVSGVTRTPAAVTVSESGTTANFTVVLDTQPSGNVVIDVASLDTGEAMAAPAQLTFTNADWSTPQTVTVLGIDDATVDGNQVTNIALTVNAAATADPLYDPINPADVSATTTDDDFVIIWTVPVANEPNAPRFANILAAASSPLQAATVTTSTYRVQGNHTGRIPGTIIATGSALFGLNPTGSLKAGETVSVTATSGILGAAGSSLQPRVWQFTAETDPATGVMAPHGSFGTGNSTAVALGDLNGDGDLDAVIGNSTFQAETVWLGDGSGTFTLESSFGDGDTSDVALGDLDGDGDLDAVVANSSVDETVWLNDGTGHFTQHATSLSTAFTADVTLGDLDSDGDLDLVVTNLAGPHTVWLNGGSGGFSAHPVTPTFGGTGNAQAVALGDVDGDGDLDAFVANQNAGEEVWLNDGGGNFTQLGLAFGSNASFDVALGDLDDDGDLDAVVANETGEGETVWLNNGAGTFAAHGSIPIFGGGNSKAVALGDLDGDGDLDAVIANRGGAPETVWLNDGTGGFTEHPTHDSFGTGDSYGLALGDVDGDGDLDAVVANAGSEAETVWLNREIPGLSVLPTDDLLIAEGGADALFYVVLESQPLADVHVTIATSDPSEALIVVDGVGPLLDSAELVFTPSNWDTMRTIFIEPVQDSIDDGSVPFTITTAPAVSTDDLYSGLNALDLAGVNGDDDTAGVTRTPAAVSVSETGTSANFTVVLHTEPTGNVVIDATPTDSGEASVAPPQLTFTPTDWSTPKSVTVTGVDDAIDDGNQVTSIALTVNAGATLDPVYDAIDPADVTVTTADDEEMHITATNPVANAKAAPRTANVTATANATIDAATVTQTTFRVQGEQTGRITGTYGASAGTFQLDPAGNFKPGERIRVTATSGIESTTDIALTPRVWQFTAAAGSATGAMVAHGTLPSSGGDQTWGLVLGDLDGDGDLDAIDMNQSEIDEKVWRNDGSGNFTLFSSFDSGWYNTGIALGDIDGDGDLDAVLAGSDNESVMLNDGSGNFSAHPVTPIFGGSAQGISLGDLDADGDLDAVVAHFPTAETVWLNDGAGNFSAHPTPSFGGQDSYTVALGDLDADGDLDAVVANGGDNSHPETVWLNDGSGVFTAHPTTPSFGAGRSLNAVLGDLDGDGDLDLIVVNHTESDTVWLNDGTGAFSEHSTPAFGTTPSFDAALGDLDGDGDLDLVVANVETLEETWLNDGTGTFSAHPFVPGFGGGQATAIALGDLDGDGDLDAVAGLYNASETVWLNAAPVNPPATFSATATSTSEVALTWSAAAGATAYEVYRSTSINTAYTLVTSTSDTFFNDPGRTADTTYLYKVRTVGAGGPSAYTNVDAATTTVFTDPTLTSATKIKRVHLIELRTAVNAMRTAADLGAATFTDPTITAGVTKAKRLHVIELRTALDAARATIGLGALTYTDPTVTVNSTKVKTAHVAEVRAGTQ